MVVHNFQKTALRGENDVSPTFRFYFHMLKEHFMFFFFFSFKSDTHLFVFFLYNEVNVLYKQFIIDTLFINNNVFKLFIHSPFRFLLLLSYYL